MEVQEIKQLLEKYYEGETSLAEEAQLRSLFASEEVSDELKKEFPFFQAMDKLREEREEDFFLPDRFMVKIHQEEDKAEKQKSLPRQRMMGIAASIAILLVGFAGGILYEKESLPTTEVSALKEEVGEMKRMLMFNQLNQVSASERIMAVNAAQSMDEIDSQILEALIYTVNADPNANVRLAAVEALAHFAADSVASNALKKSLNSQSDPMVQIAIIDVLVERNERDAVPEIQQLLQKENLEKVVREQAEFGLSQLL
ncbi:HEAT repeat domain-containing protein [Catalinimonas niigatensis]|uniref:HEAT repeat domain-containing protein n=1 Tax=Catalinimonas niigatensis TaxID=1397264 RepID=UPI0026666E31|nr:HEAT repeat domain-containing protein [Catalinimonas niigatensis]WPP51538.1 HEAT repeat domain-containing protein [Catalinimonas niigatensis]